MITSPPYNVTKEYDNNLSLNEYLDLLNRVWKENIGFWSPEVVHVLTLLTLEENHISLFTAILLKE